MARKSLPPGPGRPKGSPNKTTAELKQMILNALHAEGGEEYLRRAAREQVSSFLALLGKILPTQLAGDPAQPVVVEMTSAERELEARNLVRAAFGKPLLTIEHIQSKGQANGEAEK